LKFLFWVNPPAKRQQRLDVSFAARLATNAPGQDLPLATVSFEDTQPVVASDCQKPLRALPSISPFGGRSGSGDDSEMQ
jgi:hypothetical protein